MPTVAADIRESVAHMPAASALALDGVDWDEYQAVLEELESRPGVRVTYDRGRLDIVTTSAGHERWKEFVQNVVRAVCQELGVDMESYGGMTQQSRRHMRGAEADTCFYIANAERMRGRDAIDVTRDPPPDIVVEVDKASQSRRKLPVYATFGVPEVWRCFVRKNRVEMLQLRGDAYVPAPSSRFLPMLTGEVLARFVERSGKEGQTAALNAVGEWAKR